MADTTAGAALTRAHRSAQETIATQTALDVQSAWGVLDLRNLDRTQARWLDTVSPVVVDGRKSSIRASAAYLRSFSVVETGTAMTVVEDVIDAAVREAVATSLRVVGPVQVKALTGSGVALEAASRTAAEAVTGAVVRHVLDGGRVTAERSVGRDSRTVGWRRIGVGANCRFCSMLIGRGEVYTAETVRFTAHDHCNCAAEPAYSGAAASPVQWAASERTGRSSRAVNLALSKDGLPDEELAALRLTQARAELPVLERSLADLERRAAAGESVSGPLDWQRARVAELRRIAA